MIIISILLLLALILAYIIFAPIVLFIDTYGANYYIGMPGLFRINLIFEDDWFKIKLRILFYRFELNQKKSKKNKIKKEKIEKINKEKESRFNYKKMLKFIPDIIKDLINTFKIRQLDLNLDTGNYILNAYLLSLFSFNRKQNWSLTVNYNSEFEFLLRIENRISKLIFVGSKYIVKFITT